MSNYTPHRITKSIIFFVAGIFITFLVGNVVIYKTPVVNQPIEKITTTNSPTTEPLQPNYKIETYVENLSVPWSLVFTSSSRLLITERPGRIREVVNGKLNDSPLITFPEINSVQEEGLMGLEKDPHYDANHYLYASLSYPKNNGYVDKVVRLIDNQTAISMDKTLVDNIPAAQVHAGSRLKFGPDGKLYITTGDATQKDKAQDKEFLGGKILRMNSDGSIPEDNPFQESYVYSYGHRNPQGIAWNFTTKDMYETEHGPSGFDGPGGGDEINHITSAGNYGWPFAHHDIKKNDMTSPLKQFTPAVAPASALIYSGKIFPQFTGNLFFGGLKGAGLYRVAFDSNNPDKIVLTEKLSDINVGRVRDVIEGSEGYIYFSSSNRDGRGTPNTNDDKIYRLIPQ